MIYRVVSCSLALLLVACSGDADGDGLSNREEKKLGSDPEVADTDGDGLGDFEESELGTDPTLLDTDGDTYTDADEVTEGTDPLDEDDRIYVGYWPYNPNKDDLGDPGFDSTARAGDQIGRLITVDHFGDEFDLYDYAGHGKPILLDVSASWCPPCQAVGEWLSDEGDPYDLESEYADVRAAVNNGEIYWVTVLSEDKGGNQPDVDDLAAWDEDYPNHAVPVIADQDYAIFGQLAQNGFPSFHAIDGDTMVIEYRNATNSQYLDFKALDEVLGMLAE